MTQGNLHLQDTETSYEIHPNVLQGRASNPNSSSWVSASAGSGKTKVLTDRILRLLLPQENGTSGTQPHKILALTFTKAAASEMELRIKNTLSSWATLSDKELENNLTSLLERTPSPKDIASARRLFAKVIDAQGGLPIMTIHSFCTSILSRFPLEAGLSPQNKALEEPQARELLGKAQKKLMRKAAEEKGSLLSQAVLQLTEEQNEEQFSNLFLQIMSERAQMRRILNDNFGVDGLYSRLCDLLNVDAGTTVNDLLIDFSKKTPENDLYEAVKFLSDDNGTKTVERSIIITKWLETKNEFHNYKKAFLTQKK